MKQDKRPKIQEQVNINKTPKIQEDPARYKDQNISWQLNRLDLEGKWGISSFKNQITFSYTGNLLQDLVDHYKGLDQVPVKVNDALEKLDGKTFNSIEDFIIRLNIESNGGADAAIIKFIVKAFQQNIFWVEVFPKLAHFESNNWNVIEKEPYGKYGKTKHHSVAISALIPEAQKRLIELKLDDIEELFSIRLTGKIRIWGIRKLSYLQVLWFDFEHEVCPSTYN
ncbi:MAG TPA: hypothetical protein VNS32_09540 [Flavisolibacter sp.]|nr:hypothetical protein [Flavisolibacter sp.]